MAGGRDRGLHEVPGPGTFASGSGLLKEAEQVKKAGDFRNLYDSCRKSGRAVRRLEKAAREVENSLLEMETCKNRFSNAASDESASALKRSARKLKKEFQDFPKLVEQFEQEIRRLEKENEESGFKTVEDETAAETRAGNFRMRRGRKKREGASAKVSGSRNTGGTEIWNF